MMPEELATDRAIIEAATPPPWLSGSLDGGPAVIPSGVDEAGWPHLTIYTHSAADAAFIAAARTRWPAALDEIERLRRALASIVNDASDGTAAFADGVLKAESWTHSLTSG